jgi:hypothetical protein
VTTATAAAVIGIDRKSLDNLILRLGSDTLPPGRQGVERRIPVTLLAELLVTVEFIRALDIPARHAFELARRGLTGDTGVGPFARLAIDVESVQAELEDRLSTAIESVVRRRRGRPRIGP